MLPKMGKNAPRSSLTSALFSPVQERVLALLFGQPQRQFQLADLIALARSGSGAVQRQMERLIGAGIVEVVPRGHQKLYRARADCPIFPELHGLVLKTVGLVEPIRAVLGPLRSQIDFAFVFGSMAKGTERAGSDIDLLVVSNGLGYGDVYEAVLPVEKVLARPINPTVMTAEEWRRRRSGPDSFAVRIAQQPKLFVIGSQDDLG
jgi:predicted nucleotidyltransferase